MILCLMGFLRILEIIFLKNENTVVPLRRFYSLGFNQLCIENIWKEKTGVCTELVEFDMYLQSIYIILGIMNNLEMI